MALKRISVPAMGDKSRAKCMREVRVRGLTMQRPHDDKTRPSVFCCARSAIGTSSKSEVQGRLLVVYRTD